jgi:hypothetical protein
MSVAALRRTNRIATVMSRPDDRVGGVPAGQHAERPGDDGQRGEAVRARVQPVGDERRRADRRPTRMR